MFIFIVIFFNCGIASLNVSYVMNTLVKEFISTFK